MTAGQSYPLMHGKRYSTVFCFFTEFTERTKKRENHGSDVDWYSCADRGSNWLPVHVLQLVRFRTFVSQEETRK